VITRGSRASAERSDREEEMAKAERGAMGRRGMLAGAAALAAGAIAAKSSEAVRANGEIITVGATINGITAETRLVATTTGGAPLLHLLQFGDGSALAFNVSGTAPGAVGVSGISDHTDAIAATTKGGSPAAGVRGVATGGGIGVVGSVPSTSTAANAVAVQGSNQSQGAGGIGVQGASGNGLGGSFQGGLAPLRLVPGVLNETALAPAGHQAGELYVTADNHLFFFDGSAWRQVLLTPLPSNLPPQRPPQPPPPGATVQPAPQPRSG
jgi:hypothetical protein